MFIDPEMLSRLRHRMMSVAYRMLGTVADAEDAVQDAFVRLQEAGGVSSPEGFLVRTTTRLCIDRLRARRRRGYVGPWVPEPVETKGLERESALAESLSQAFLLLLERLTPDERATFLLRTVFDYEYAAIGEMVGRPGATVRQLVSRAHRRLGLGSRRVPARVDGHDPVGCPGASTGVRSRGAASPVSGPSARPRAWRRSSTLVARRAFQAWRVHHATRNRPAPTDSSTPTPDSAVDCTVKVVRAMTNEPSGVRTVR